MEEHNQDRSAYKDHVPAPPLPLKHPFYKELLFDRLLHGVMCPLAERGIAPLIPVEQADDRSVSAY